MFGFFKKTPAGSAPSAPSTTQAEAAPASPAPTWRERLKAGLARTRAQFGGKLKSIFARGKVDDDPTLRNLIEANTSAVCIVAKSSEYQVVEALQSGRVGRATQ